ncbi:TPA: sigma factor-like helix-turn-helix DNA-binding protein [Clostridium botulinum]|uniref:sigma factor-like helix-turn-helix DNA-binding protein n=1 Tax=Clostridium botulinum TaxID=1491 RepID=UPI001C9AB338|nr:sigma factor-like helix-turn-helix DNA-binding protein [Clostridium botulinum]MBY6909538.1 sigma-70 family RNA polymerase sigma factor [Clostridium botulinum]
MGAGKYTVPFIVSLAQNRDKISESRFYKADLSASDLLMDLEIILDRANLTDKQRYILENCWIKSYTQEEVACDLGVTQQMVEKHCRAIKKKIRKILKDMGELKHDKK